MDVEEEADETDALPPPLFLQNFKALLQIKET